MVSKKCCSSTDPADQHHMVPALQGDTRQREGRGSRRRRKKPSLVPPCSCLASFLTCIVSSPKLEVLRHF